MFICLWINYCHPPVKLATPLQGGGENFRLALCHPPDQNAETASDAKGQGQTIDLMFVAANKLGIIQSNECCLLLVNTL